MSNNEIENVSVNARRLATRSAGSARAKTLIGISSALLTAILILAGVAIRVRAQGQGGETADMIAYRTAMEDADQKILAEEQSHSELMKNLEHLTTQIGPRLTGSKQMQDASAWTLKRFHDYGIDAHLESAQIPHAWTRGADTAEIISPISRRIPLCRDYAEHHPVDRAPASGLDRGFASLRGRLGGNRGGARFSRAVAQWRVTVSI